jgi:hypothetical protein
MPKPIATLQYHESCEHEWCSWIQEYDKSECLGHYRDEEGNYIKPEDIHKYQIKPRGYC